MTGVNVILMANVLRGWGERRRILGARRLPKTALTAGAQAGLAACQVGGDGKEAGFLSRRRQCAAGLAHQSGR